ncbi:hypothetical protein BJ166DRAFT_347766 [Pestalotiopsis sp. NC0098]|nr:hypothetical protein BJ166DRAFT_347766 [Pestalotiopsis sp. NC0098]
MASRLAATLAHFSMAAGFNSSSRPPKVRSSAGNHVFFVTSLVSLVYSISRQAKSLRAQSPRLLEILDSPIQVYPDERRSSRARLTRETIPHTVLSDIHCEHSFQYGKIHSFENFTSQPNVPLEQDGTVVSKVDCIDLLAKFVDMKRRGHGSFG